MGADETTNDASSVRARIELTGIPGLDSILGGGLPRGSLVLLIGPPGCGKTTLAAALAFAAVHSGWRVVFLTGLSEPSDKLLRHLRGFTFFDETVVGDQLQVLSMGSFLTEGVPATADQVVAEVRHRHADLLVLDGFSSIRLAAASPLESREFLYEVGGALGVLGTTTVITAEADPRTSVSYAEATGADVLLSLSLTLHGVHPRRTIEPIKVRGAAPLLGLHSMVIDRQGIAVYPRLEARVLEERQVDASTPIAGTKALFGLPQLDGLLDGGLTSGTPTVVMGSPGTGKTLLGLYFLLAGIAAGEPAVFLGFHEDAAELQLKADTFALGDALRAALAPGGGLTLLRRPPIEGDVDLLAHELLAAVDRTGARRVVIDSMVELERAVLETGNPARVPNYLAALTEACRLRRVSLLLTKETGALGTAALSLSADQISVVVATVIWLQQVTVRGRIHRVLSVPKMRFSAHDTTPREYVIAAPDGLVVRGAFESESVVPADLAQIGGDVVSEE